MLYNVMLLCDIMLYYSIHCAPRRLRGLGVGRGARNATGVSEKTTSSREEGTWEDELLSTKSGTGEQFLLNA